MQPPPSTSPAVEYAQKSDPGRDPEKQVNEDACGYRATRFGHLCVVCDGMGGHAGGKEASNLALETIFQVFDAAPDGSLPGAVLRDSIAEANRRVHALSAKGATTARPGSTAVAVLLHAAGTEIAHVGDSRCYLVHQDQIFQVTKDHSMVQQLVDAGLLTPAQAAVHPQANQITRALGMVAEVDVDLRPQPIAHVVGDAFVLCSDGLSDLVEPPEILQIVGSAPAAQAAGQLVDLANARGGHDNVTVVVLRARESASVQAGSVAPTMIGTEVSDTIAEVPSSRITLPGDVSPATARAPHIAPGGPLVVPPLAPPPTSSGTLVPSSRQSAASSDPRVSMDLPDSIAPPRPRRSTALTVTIVVLVVIGTVIAISATAMHLRDKSEDAKPKLPAVLGQPTTTTTATTTSTPASSDGGA